MSSLPLLQCQNLRKTYYNGYQKTIAVQRADVMFYSGRFYAVVGRSGCGKSTFLRLAAGIECPESGRVLYKDQDLYQLDETKRAQIRGKEFGFVFQSYQLLPELNVHDNIALPCWLNRKHLDDKISQLCESLGLSDKQNAYPNQLSGGQQQRVALARAFIQDPAIIFADEPTGNLDPKNRNLVMTVLKNWQISTGGTLILVSHDHEVYDQADEIFYMENGVIVS